MAERLGGWSTAPMKGDDNVHRAHSQGSHAPVLRREGTRSRGTTGRTRGIVSSRVSGARVEAATYPSTPRLGPVVKCCWTTGWNLHDQAPHHFELIPDPCINVVFEEGQSRIVGVWTRRWTRTLSGSGHIRAVKLRAGACRAWLTAPAYTFTNRIQPMASYLGKRAHELERAVLAPESDRAGIDVIERWLEDALDPQPPESLVLAVALAEEIASNRTILSVDALASQAGVGMRFLQKIFREFVGASPKVVIRMHRLQEAAFRIENGTAPSLAALAAELGYTDQAHLARDFKAVVGRTPREFELAVHA